MVFERTAPDGRVLFIAWLEPYGVWRAKVEGEAAFSQGQRPAEAIAAASGDPEDADWIVDLARELEAAIDRADRDEALT